MKTKYRIVQTYMSDHSIQFRVDERFMLFFWDKGRHFDTIDQARQWVAVTKRSDNRPKDVVIQED